jgi:hypothetical protein
VNSIAVRDKNGGSCSVPSSNAVIAPDGHLAADGITTVPDTPVIQQQIAGLADGGAYTSSVWALLASGARNAVSSLGSVLLSGILPGAAASSLFP